MKRNYFLQFTLIAISLLISKSESGRGSGNESFNVFFGIPLLYQQRQELAQELGVNPVIPKRDFLYRDPLLFPLGYFNNPLEDNSLHSRKKRGIIWNKLKKFKIGMYAVKNKIMKMKQKAVSIVKGPNKNTPKPKYESTGGSWGRPVQKPQGWGMMMPMNPRPNYGNPESYGSYGNGYTNKEYGISGPITRNSAATSGWESNYKPPHSNHYIKESSYFNYSNNHYKNMNEPNYSGLAVRSRVKAE